MLCLNGRQVAFGAPAETLTRDVLEETYGADVVTASHHHHHDERDAN